MCILHFPSLSQSLDTLFHFFFHSIFSLHFSLGCFYWHIFKLMNSFVGWLLATSLLVSRSKSFFIFVTMFLSSNIFFWFLAFQYSCLHHPSVLTSCPFFPLDPLALLITSLIIPRSLPYLTVALSITCFVSPDYVFFLPLSRPCNLLKTRHNVLGNRN